MTALSALLVPIVLSAVIVFVASFIIHMALPWHKSDYPKVPNEDRVREALRFRRDGAVEDEVDRQHDVESQDDRRGVPQRLAHEPPNGSAPARR